MKPKNDLAGRKFGKWTAISLTAERDIGDGAMWLCECECGNTNVVSRATLRNGTSQSCGCQRHVLTPEDTRKGAPLADAKNRENGTGIYALTTEQHQELGRATGRRMKDEKRGIFAMTDEQRSELGHKNGTVNGPI